MILYLNEIINNQNLIQVTDTILNDENAYARRSIWSKNLYVKIKKNDEGEIVIKQLAISENCDIIYSDCWKSSISIDAAMANDWVIYKATIG